MTTTCDFTIISDTEISGISLVIANNEDAFSYLTEEEYTYLPNGTVPLATHKVGDFISDAGWDQYSCDLV